MTKKLQLFTLTLCLSLIGLVNTAKATNTYTLTSGANPTVNTNWGKVGNSALHPTATFNGNSAIYQLSSALNANVTLPANWTVTGSNSYVVILSGVTFSDGGHNFNSGVPGSGNATTFSVSTGAIANISGAGDITGVFSYGTINLSGTGIFENTDIESGGLLSVTGAATLNGVNPIAGTLTISNAGANVANITAASGGVVNLNAAVSLTSLQVSSGGVVNFNSNAVVTSSITEFAGGLVVYNFAGRNVIPATYNGNVTLSNTAHLLLNTAINGTFTNNSVLTLNSNLLTLGGTVAGAGTITGDNGASIAITSSTAAFGTLNFTAGSQTLDGFDMSGAAATTNVTLGTNLTISDPGDQSSILDLSSGILNLNGHTLTSDNTCVSLNLGGTITGSTTSTLQLNLASSATFVSFNGGTLMMDQTTNGSTNALSNFTFNDGGNGLTLPIGSVLDVIDSICPTSGTINASGGNYVTLIADQATVGHVGRLGMVGGTFSGNVISQVYHNPGGNNTNWVLVGSAGVNNVTFSDWDMNFKITCPTCPDGDGSAQNYGTPFTSIDAYTEAAGLGDPNAAAHYVGISNITDPITIGHGFWVFMGNSQPTTATAGELLTVTGTPQTGTSPWTITNSNGGAATDGMNLLANPYPSPISWAKVVSRNSNVITTYYAYNSTTQAYSSYNTVTGSTTSGAYGLTDVIPSGLGFYVQSLTAGSTSFDLHEQDKTSGNQIIGRLANPNSVQSIAAYFSLMIDGGVSSSHEEATISFNPNSVASIDGYDAIAFPWNGVLQITTTILGNTFMINSMPALTQNYSIPVKILSGTTTQYTISTKNLQNLPAGACVKLHDNYGVMADQDLRGGPFNVTINDTETVARFVLNVTITPLMVTTNSVDASCHAKNDGLITAVGNDAGPWNYIWKNASGVIVKTSLNKSTADTLTGLNNGVYSVDVSTVGTCNSATQTFTLVAPVASASAFTASTQVNVGDNVVLTNNSTNATNYVWNFGNGDISSQQTPTYVYNNAGTYTITLQAINANCNDTATSKQVITVNATTDIKQANTGDGNINVSRDASGNYIQFDYTNQTKVSITAYNVLGQAVLTNAELNVVNDKIYINVADNKNQVLYVTITNLITNKQTTKKFVND